MANGDKEIEYIQIGGNQKAPVRPLNEVTVSNPVQPLTLSETPSVVQGQALNQIIGDVQGQNTGGAIQPTVNDIYPDYATGYEALPYNPTMGALDNQIAAQQGAVSPGALAPQTYAPGLGKGINVGGYSGRVIGSTSLFAPQGQIVPLGIVDAREKAMQDAALKAAELKSQKAALEAQQNVWEVPSAPKLKDKNYQRAYNKEFNEFVNQSIEEGKRLYGSDWRKAIKDPTNPLGRDFQQKMATFQYIAERGNQVTDKLAEYQTAFDKGDLYLTPKSRKLVYEAYNRIGNFKDADITDLYGLEREVTKSVNLDKYLNDNKMINEYMKSVDEWIKRGAGSISSDQWNTYRKETIEPNARRMAQHLAETQFAGGAYSEQDIYENIMSKMGDVNEVKAQFQGASARANKYYEEKEDRSVVYQDEEGNFQVPGDTGDEWEDGYIIKDAENIPGGIKPGDKVKLVEANVILKNPDGGINRDSRGNPQYRSVVKWAVKRKEVVGEDLATGKKQYAEVDYIATAPADGESRPWMKKNHKSQYNALQDLSKDANIRTVTGIEEEDYEDPNRGNTNTRGFFNIQRAEEGGNNTQKNIEKLKDNNQGYNRSKEDIRKKLEEE